MAGIPRFPLRNRIAFLLIGIGLMAAAPAARAGWVPISRTGSIGPLKLDRSSAGDIVQLWGPPSYETTGNVVGTADTGYPNYDLLGYACRHRSGSTECAVNFYISQQTDRLESFATTAPQFLLFGRVHVGMSADLAARREHQPDLSGCGQGIGISTPSLSVDINTQGGTTHMRRNGIYVSGGRVVGIAIDDRPHGVGVLFC